MSETEKLVRVDHQPLVVPLWVRAQFCECDIYYGDHLYITDIAPPARVNSDEGKKWWIRHSSHDIVTLCKLMGVPVTYGGTEEAIRLKDRLIERIRKEPGGGIRVECEPSEHWMLSPRLTGNLWHNTK